MEVSAKKKNTVFAVNVFMFFAVLSFILAFAAALFLFNKNYGKIYEYPEVQDGRVNFSGVELLPRDVACNLSGQWEFFYDKWIVTDGFDGECDGMISVPSLWTYKDYGYGSLPQTGYASYRLVAENVKAGYNVVVFRHNENFAYRVYINGQLNYVSGTLSKDESKTVVTGVPSAIYPYLTSGEPLEIVVEISATSYGGLNAAPWLAAVEGGVEYGDELRTFTYITLGVSLTAVVISIFSAIFFISKKRFALPLFMVAMFVHFMASKDMMYVCELSFTATSILRLLSAVAAYAFFILHLSSEGAKFSKTHIKVGIVTAVVFSALLIVFYGTPLCAPFALGLLILAASYVYPCYFKSKFSRLQNVVYGVLFYLLITTFLFEFCDALGFLKFGTEFVFSLVLTFIISGFAFIMLYKISQSVKDSLKAKKLEKELVVMENKVLKAQIKPHFIYNSLTSVQYQYRKGLSYGDDAIEKLARHLRLITDNNENVTPFENEIKNVVNYFELESLRLNGKIDLLLDLEYTDFDVPFLSLQPFVENAVKHAGLTEVKDGYALISSRLLPSGDVEVCICDNGKGFDVTKVKDGVGLSNAKRRLAIFGATVTVRSEINRGTDVRIIITGGTK